MNDDYIQLINTALNQALNHGAQYAEVRFQDTSLRVANVENNVVKSILNNCDYGINIKILFNGAFGTTFTNQMSRNAVFKSIEEAFKIARAARKTVRLSSIENMDFKTVKYKEKKSTIVAPLEKVKYLLLASCKTASSISSYVKNVAASFGEYFGRIAFLNSFGTFIEYHPFLSAFGIRVLAKKGELCRESRGSLGGSLNYSHYERKCSERAKTVAKAATEKLKAKSLPSSKYEIIIDPVLSGILAHESFGHLAEADFVVAKSSPLAGKLGEKMGIDTMNLIDYGLAEGGFRIPFDDEGMQSSKTHIVKNGILASYLHSLETALELNEKPTGNARAQDYSCNQLVRMTNTYFDKGDWKPDEIVRETKKGIYAISHLGGRTDMDGFFSFAADRAYLIINGEIKEPLIGVTLSGNIFDFMKKIDAISDDLAVQSTIFGACIKKGQRAFVGGGGPHLRVKNLAIGEKQNE